MTKKEAENIQTVTQSCIRELNMLLRNQQGNLSDEEFKLLKSTVAQAMGQLIHVEDCSVYKQFPELRPYEIGSKS